MDMDSAHPKSVDYALNGKIMLCSVTILFVVVFVVACFHSYVRLCFNRNHPSRRRRRRRRNSNNIISAAASITNIGLDLSVVKNLPSFVYSAATHDDLLLECAVCLSEFEDGEQGRLLPSCKHAFHTECIDTWFQCHSNCPLCRSPIRLDIRPVPETRHEIAITVNEEEAGSPSFSGEEYCAREALDLVVGEMSMDDRLRQFGTSKSREVKFSGNNKILTLKRIWSI